METCNYQSQNCRLKSCINESGLKIDWIRKKAQIPTRWRMSQILSGNAKPTIKESSKIAKILGVKAEEIFD